MLNSNVEILNSDSWFLTIACLLQLNVETDCVEYVKLCVVQSVSKLKVVDEIEFIETGDEDIIVVEASLLLNHSIFSLSLAHR